MVPAFRLTADGGAIVLDSDGEALVTVFPPYAVDAQGTNVPVTLSVDGDSIKLDVPHQGKDFAYPIMVDPVQHVRDWWTNGSTPGFEGWSFYQDGTTQYNNSLDCPSSLASVDPCGGTGTGSGVYVSAVPTRTYPAGSKAYWRWVAPGGASSSITGATLSSWRYRKGNTNAGWAFYNLYNPTTNTSNGTTMTDGGGGSGLSLTGGNSGFKYLQSGLATNTANTIPTGASNWRYNRVAGYTATLTDGEAPTLDLGAGPTTWLPANTAFTVNAEGKDPGLGMGWINAQINGIWTNKWVGWCTGTYPYTCPATTGTQALSFNTNDFPNGVNTVSVNAMDIIAGTGHETAKPFTVKVDKSAPQVNLSGSLASIATGRSDLPQYDLMVNIKDGTAGTDNQSGVKTVKITIDGEEQSFPVNCSTYNCSFYLTEPYIVDALTYGSGSHNITVQATDMVNQQTTKSIDFTLNDLSKPAVTATGAIMAAGTPAVGVDQSVDFHATDVGYGVQKVEAKIDGLVVDSVEADSDCLAGDCALDGNLMVDSTGLAPGQHQLSLVATDFNGNVSNTLTKTYELDSGLPVVDVTGSLVDMSGLPLDDEILEANVQATDSANTHDTGIAKLAVKVDDVLVDEQTFSCSSSCASNHTFSYEYDATAVGEGPHDVTFIATDGAGNIGTQEFQMDTSEIPDSTICPTEGVDEVEAENPVSAEDAVVGIDSATPEVVGQLPMGSTPSGQDVQPMMAEAPEDSANPEKYEVSGSLAQTEASATDVPTVEVGDVVCLQPTRTTDAATEPAVVEDQALVYANTDSETDTTIRGTADGAAVVTTIRGSSAPKKFSWAVGLDDDQSLQMLADGSIAVVDNAISTNPTSTPDPVDPLQIEDLVEMDRLMEDGEYQLAAAQARVATSHVSAVLPDPVAEDANGNPVSVSYSISGGEITMNLGITGSTPLPVTVMSRFSSNPDMRDCLAGHAPCGEFNRARAAAYAQNWGQGRNPNYSDFGSNDCTNFVSQILRAGEMKFMREYKKGDGSWWSTRTRGRFGYEIRSTDSWRLADVLPQHLWEYHLGDRIYTGMNTWTSRDVIAWSWHNDGEVDHLQFVSGWSHNRDVPLIANHSGEGSNYGRMIWPRVLNRVHRDYPNADFRVLRIRNTRANIYEDGYPPRPTQFW